MASKHRPHRGSLAVLPRKRAKSQRPVVKSWPKSDDVKPLGFSGYKAGMTHVIAVDETENSPTNGMEIFIPVTIVETPPMTVVGIRVYEKGYDGLQAYNDFWMDEAQEDVRTRAPIPIRKGDTKKFQELKEKIDELEDVRLIIYTHPEETHLPQKKPDIMEIGIGGNLEEKFDYATENLGKQLKISDVFEENQFLDVTSVTKGKGFQGIIKRYGVKKSRRKSAKGERHMGSGGAWTPTRKLWTEPLPGQMGYHKRTEFNKLILSIGEDGAEINPAGGFLHYGLVKNNYILLHGSIPGPAKRIIRLTQPKRVKNENTKYSILNINTESKQGN